MGKHTLGIVHGLHGCDNSEYGPENDPSNWIVDEENHDGARKEVHLSDEESEEHDRMPGRGTWVGGHAGRVPLDRLLK
jgi:hypothetical protein